MGLPPLAKLGARRHAVPGTVTVLLLIGALIVWVFPKSGEMIGAMGLIVGYMVAGTLFWRRSSNLPIRESKAWRYMSLGGFLVATGVLVVGVLTESGAELPAFGAHDVFFLGGYLALTIALYRLARSEGDGRNWALTILDALVGAIALAALVWTAFYHDLVEVFVGAPPWEAAIAMTYPLVDMAAVIALMILVIRRSHYHLDPRLVFVALGMSVQVFADFVYLSRGVGESFTDVSPAFALNLLAAAFFVTGATLVNNVPKKREFPESDTPILAFAWPYLLAGALLTTLVVQYRSLGADGDQVLLLDAVLAIGVVIFLRQMLVIFQNRLKVENQRSELVASVSHELRTPLTAIVGYLTLLDENTDDFPEDARREMISEATRQATHMSRLVSDLIVLARGNQRPLSIEVAEASLSDVVSAALRSVDAESTKIEAEEAEDVRIHIDADRIQQALSNLIGNAVKYGGDRVLLTTSVTGEDLTLQVHDNGEGVPTRYESMVWNRFERGAHRLDATAPGLGIGLAIVRAVAVSHGGTATYCRSERLGGACFEVSIPGCVVVPSSSEKVEITF